jgi:hypothetical protein
MAISYTVKTTKTSTGWSTSLTTSSFTPDNNTMLLVLCTGLREGQGTPTFGCSGGGLSWTKRYESKSGSDFGPWGVVYTASVVTGASMTVQVTFSNTQMGSVIRVYQITGADETDPIGNTADDEYDGHSSGSFTMSISTTASDSLTIGWIVGDEWSSVSLDTGNGWTNDGYVEGDDWAYTNTGTKEGSIDTVHYTCGTLSYLGGTFAVEVQAAAAAAGYSFGIIY